MNLRAGLKMGMEEMVTHRLRTVLTMLGIVFGVATFIALFSLLEGSFAEQEGWLKENGGLEKAALQDYALEKKDKVQARPNRSRGRTLKDAEALALKAGLVDEVSPETDQNLPLKHGGEEVWVRVLGGREPLLRIYQYEVARGRFISDLDQKGFHSVCVLGSQPAKELFGNEDPLGKTVIIQGHPVEVVGLLKHYAKMYGEWNAFEWKNKICIMPLTAFMRRQAGSDKLASLNLRIKNTASIPWALDQARNLLLRRHGVEDFKFETNQGWADNLEKQQIMFGVILGIIGGICMLSGGVGIMNIMLATVKERTREIGVRRALGARRKDILVQFLLETLVLSVVGGLSGVALGTGLAALLSLLPQQVAVISFWPSAVAFVSAVLVSLFFGLYPAIRASKLDPIEALRYE